MENNPYVPYQGLTILRLIKEYKNSAFIEILKNNLSVDKSSENGTEYKYSRQIVRPYAALFAQALIPFLPKKHDWYRLKQCITSFFKLFY